MNEEEREGLQKGQATLARLLNENDPMVRWVLFGIGLLAFSVAPRSNGSNVSRGDRISRAQDFADDVIEEGHRLTGDSSCRSIGGKPGR